MVGMQHSEEVGAGEELGAGGLEQQGEARPGIGLSHTVVSTQLCNTHSHQKVHMWLQDVTEYKDMNSGKCDDHLG